MREKISAVTGCLIEGERELMKGQKTELTRQLPGKTVGCLTLQKKDQKLDFKQDHLGTKLPLSERVIYSGMV